MKAIAIRGRIFFALLLAVGGGFALQAQTYTVGWSKIAGGGGTCSVGTNTLNCTIGQPDASVGLTACADSLSGGFWELYSAPLVGFALGRTIFTTGSAAASDSVVIAAPATSSFWTALSDASWLHIKTAEQSGTGSTNVVFSCDTNFGPTRESALIVAGHVVSIMQAGSTYVPAQPVTLVPGINFGSGNFAPVGLTVVPSGNIFISDEGQGAVEEWSLANNTVAEVVQNGSGPTNADDPQGISSDGLGNIYFGTGANDVREWTAASGQVSMVVSGLPGASYVAVDMAGSNVDFTDNNGLQQWTRGVGLHTLVAGESTFNGVPQIGVDALDNIFIDAFQNVDEWVASAQFLKTLIPGVRGDGIAVDGGDNLYIVENYPGNGLFQWSAASGTLTEIFSNTLASVAVDGSGDVYFIAVNGNDTSRTLMEMPNAFVDPTPKYEPNNSGSDTIPPVVPVTQNLLPPLNPTSDQSWLTITSTSGGVVTYSFTKNTSPYLRTGHISLLGQSIAVTQIGALMTLLGTFPAKGVFQLNFSSTNSATTYEVLSTTNLLLPLSNWTVVGLATNIAPDFYQFSLPVSNHAGFYMIRSP